MNKILISSFLAMLMFSGCDINEITNSGSDSDVEKIDIENDDSNENYELHNQGAACLSCHGLSSGSVEYDDRFTSGGTVYTAIDSASGYATGYKIRLVLENTLTEVTYEIEEGDGNSYTEYSDGSINGYTAQVINSNGDVVNSSNTNSHGVARLDCNSCHTADGINGAPGRITSFDYYASLPSVVTNTTTVATISFANAVMPVLENKCKVCHSTTSAFTTPFIINDSASTYTNISTSGYTNTTSVDSSLLLTKGIGINHTGNAPLVDTSSTEYQTIKDWISQGALNN